MGLDPMLVLLHFGQPTQSVVIVGEDTGGFVADQPVCAHIWIGGGRKAINISQTPLSPGRYQMVDALDRCL